MQAAAMRLQELVHARCHSCDIKAVLVLIADS